MEDKIPNEIPPFDGSNFEYWKNRMETYLKALGADVWFSVALGYNALNKQKNATQKEQQIGNRYHPGWIDRFSEIQGEIGRAHV